MYARVRMVPLFVSRDGINPLVANGYESERAARGEWTPAVDIQETDQALTFAVELPGIKPGDVEVTANDGLLTIRGERTWGREEQTDGRYHLVERNYGSFIRQFRLPPGVDSDKIQADVEDGMLRVSIPKAAMPQPKRIPIRAGAGTTAQRALGRGAGQEDAPKKAAAARRAT